jgi:hypothetical protein
MLLIGNIPQLLEETQLFAEARVFGISQLPLETERAAADAERRPQLFAEQVGLLGLEPRTLGL